VLPGTQYGLPRLKSSKRFKSAHEFIQKWRPVERGKIEGKSKYTRGVFVSINGVSKEAASAITQGKQANFFTIDGYDLTMLLEDNIDITKFLRTRQRLLAEEGLVIVPFNQLEM
jgi:hypothetical protein